MEILAYVIDDHGEEFELTLEVEGSVQTGGSNARNSDEPPWVEVYNMTYELAVPAPKGLPLDWKSRVDDNAVASKFIEESGY